ncbi:MAG: hypothetical protein ACREBS_05785 [Nitrososphaerales archaeon]
MQSTTKKQSKTLSPEKESSRPDSRNPSLVDEEVAKAVLAGLGHFGPGSIVESLVYILELEHSVEIQSVAANPEFLRAALSKMFGGAAYVVETKICQALAKRLGVDGEGKSFEDLISMLRSMTGAETITK